MTNNPNPNPNPNPSSTPASGERRPFLMDPNLLVPVIKRQAGTLSKAVLEGVMNSADAGAATLQVTIDPDGRTIRLKDDGRGFRTRDEIKTWFEVFGFEHQESEHKVFGEFRMGRGQMFAFGKNIWRTGAFTMIVDIEREGIGYRLLDEPEVAAGCCIDIELYKRLDSTDQYNLSRDLALWCKYAPVEVILNGKSIGSPPSRHKWDRETDDAFIRLKATGGLRRYNLGIYVDEQPSHRFGCGGEVVSKRALKVNFARNDVQHDCPEWAKIQRTVREMAGSKPKTARMTDGERQHLAEKIITGQLTGYDACKAKVITAVNGRHYTVDSFLAWTQMSLAESGDRPAERAMDNDVAFMLSKETLDRFDLDTPSELLMLLRKAGGQFVHRVPRIVAYEEAVKAFSGVRETLDESDLNPNLRAWLALAERGYYPIWSAAGNDESPGKPRKLLAGQSVTDHAWTDGTTYITISNDFLESLPWNSLGFTKLGILLVQMFAYDDDSTTGLPDQTYFELVHRLQEKALPQFVQMCVEGAPRVLEKEGRRMTKQIAAWQSELQRVDAAKDAFAKQKQDHDAASRGHQVD